MIIEVEAAAVSRRLVHLESVKADLGITDTSSDADLLAAIDRVSADAVRILGREPWRQQYKVRLPGDGGTMLALPVWPAETPSLVRYGVDSPVTMDADDYEVVDRQGQGFYRWLYRSDHWARQRERNPHRPGRSERELYYEVTLYAGWACPIRTWEASTAVRLGEYCLATDRSNTTVQECTTAGTTHTAEPATWSTTDGSTTAEGGGSAVWTARATARALPEEIHLAGIWAAKQVFAGEGGGAPAGIAEESHGRSRIRYDTTAAGLSVLPAVSQQIIEAYAA